MITILITTVHVIVCFLLIAVILLQAGRGQGLTGPNFGSGNVQSLFGTRAADFLSKATTVAAICFLFTCIGLDIIEVRKSRSLLEGNRQQTAPVDVAAIKKALEKIKEEQKTNTPPAPAAKPAETNAAAPSAPNP
ncbi:MAG: preprotein translocase subunit SecG [Candidatus Omnitrophica bacterium]|nr:preprotein translocase subunit SecG [Candidatus Omnitrophota bacterium]